MNTTGSGVLLAYADGCERRDRSWLAERGELCAGSGVLRSPEATVAFHSRPGTGRLREEPNQDFVLGWMGNRSDTGVRSPIALALADGLTSSFAAELAARVACWRAVRTLVDQTGGSRSADPLAAAARVAAEALKSLAAEAAHDPVASCPTDQYPATWKYILRHGLLLQTTLSLVWIEPGRIEIGLVGDGGLVWCTDDPRDAAVETHPDLAADEVRCLGPGETEPADLDHRFVRPLAQSLVCAVYTDGVGRGLGQAPLSLFASFRAMPAAVNPARQYLDDVVSCRPHAFADDLTLAVIRSAPGDPG